MSLHDSHAPSLLKNYKPGGPKMMMLVPRGLTKVKITHIDDSCHYILSSRGQMSKVLAQLTSTACSLLPTRIKTVVLDSAII